MKSSHTSTPGHVRALTLLAGTLLLAALSNACVGNESAAEMERISVQRFSGLQSQLQGQLKAALQKTGPAGAIKVCATASPGAEKALSNPRRLAIRRVSDRPRNPDHKADEFEARALKEWQQARAAGKPLKVISGKHKGKFKVLKPIVIKSGTCLACHGGPQQMDAATSAAIRKEYPKDQATGYKLGDLRGAFSATWTLYRPKKK